MDVPARDAAPLKTRETVMKTDDMRVTVVSLGAGGEIAWHYHTAISDVFVCLEGPMIVETRAPRAEHRLQPGDRCEVPPNTAHHAHGVDGGPFRFMLIQGVGPYDNFKVDAGRIRNSV